MTIDPWDIHTVWIERLHTVSALWLVCQTTRFYSSAFIFTVYRDLPSPATELLPLPRDWISVQLARHKHTFGWFKHNYNTATTVSHRDSHKGSHIPPHHPLSQVQGGQQTGRGQHSPKNLLLMNVERNSKLQLYNNYEFSTASITFTTTNLRTPYYCPSKNPTITLTIVCITSSSIPTWDVGTMFSKQTDLI